MYDEASVARAAQQPIEFMKLAAFTFPTHPPIFTGIPEAVAVEQDDTVETLHERIKVVERSLFPRTIRAYAKERVG